MTTSVTEEISPNCGAVVIGRNEGLRLEACLRSLEGQVGTIVYVDSGSSDNSLEIAGASSADIVELDMAKPFTAARARNAGFERLMEMRQSLSYVQFVDGDCIITEGWLESAHSFLEVHADVAITCGRLCEKHPELTFYSRLSDEEWDSPIGEIAACGGLAMIRADVFREVSGFNETIIAAEDDDLCIRMRAKGHRIIRLPEEMALHDIAISKFGQWWKRAVRAGYGFAHVGALHSGPPEFYFTKDRQRIWIWSLGIPLTIVILAYYYGANATLFLLVYPLAVVRLAWRHARSGRPVKDGLFYGLFMMLSKFAGLVGMLRYYGDKLVNRQPKIIEYKTSTDR